MSRFQGNVCMGHFKHYTFNSLKDLPEWVPIEVTLTHTDLKPAGWGDNRFHWIVMLINKRSGEHCTFDFWDSKHNCHEWFKYIDGNTTREIMFAERLAKDALASFLHDAMTGDEYSTEADFGAFMEEFGYDGRDGGKAYQAFRGCQKACKDAERVLGDSKDFATIYNILEGYDEDEEEDDE